MKKILTILVAVVFAVLSCKGVYNKQKSEEEITMVVPVYSEINYVSSNVELTSFKRDGKYGYTNSKGEEVIPPKYDMTYSFSEGLAQVGKAGKWGFINEEGKEVIPLIYNRSNARKILNNLF